MILSEPRYSPLVVDVQVAFINVHKTLAVEVLEKGPVVQLGDGKRAHLKKKTAELIFDVSVQENSKTKYKWWSTRLAVIPGTSRRLLLDQPRIKKLQIAMGKR